MVEHQCQTDAMPGHIQSIERAVAVLRLLAAAPQDLALQEIAESLELPKATTHGIVATLRHVGLVRQDRGTARYRLDAELQGLPGGGLDPNLLRSHAMNWADSLAANTGEAVLIGIPSPQGVEVIHHVFCPDGSRQRLRVGEIRPVHASALGKVLLAHTPWLRSRLRQSSLESYTSRTTTDREALLDEVRRIKRVGYSVDVGEYVSEQGAIAAPIRQYGGLGVGAISVVGPTDRIFSTHGVPHREITDRVIAAARAVSEQLAESR
jgi:DNA-binding IclR family transcriptional regulator